MDYTVARLEGPTFCTIAKKVLKIEKRLDESDDGWYPISRPSTGLEDALRAIRSAKRALVREAIHACRSMFNENLRHIEQREKYSLSKKGLREIRAENDFLSKQAKELETMSEWLSG